VSAAVVDDMPAVLANPHFRARGEIVSVDDSDLGATTTAAPALGGLGTIRHLGRALGADNRTVYVDWLGIDDADLDRLRAAGVV
jgi:crotonobetainyl-CoA:carnitine CoA-transferase CaiB-like acyl-CoA transferase